MKLLSATFENVLGLNGQISFEENKPLLIYGDNIAGKSNIINMLRYCLIPKAKTRKAYVEEKRLKKNEILLESNSQGRIEIFFEQENTFYRLSYTFSRKTKSVGEVLKLFEGQKTIIPTEDDPRCQALKKIEWQDLGVKSLKSLRENLLEIGIYPEIIVEEKFYNLIYDKVS